MCALYKLDETSFGNIIFIVILTARNTKSSYHSTTVFIHFLGSVKMQLTSSTLHSKTSTTMVSFWITTLLFIASYVTLSLSSVNGAPVLSNTESKIINYAGAIIDLVMDDSAAIEQPRSDFRAKRNSESITGFLQGANYGHMAGIGKRNAESLGDMLQQADYKRMELIGKRNSESLKGMLQGANYGHLAGIGKRNAEELTRILQDPSAVAKSPVKFARTNRHQT